MSIFERLNRALRLREKEDIPLRDVLQTERFEPSAALFEQMMKGILENQILLDALLCDLSKLPLRKYRREEYYYLLIGAYGVVFMEKPDYVFINEIVNLMKRSAPHRASATNAILRRLAREKDKRIERIIDKKDPKERLSLTYSVHEEFVELLLQQYDCEDVENYFRYAQKKPPLDICVISRDREGYREELSTMQIEANVLQGTHGGLRIASDHVTINHFPGFEEGQVYIMGFASQLVSEQIPAGSHLLDLCAAPGGKSIALKNRLPEVSLTCCDIDPMRLEVLHSNLRRVRMEAEVYQLDAKKEHPPFIEAFNLVLLDAPCTSSGLLARHPELRNTITADRLDRSTRIQKELLQQAAKYVKKGGFLIYSTCSILKQEGREQIDVFLQKQREFSLFNASLSQEADSSGFLQTYPWRDDCDGFFAATLQRK